MYIGRRGADVGTGGAMTDFVTMCGAGGVLSVYVRGSAEGVRCVEGWGVLGVCGGSEREVTRA